MSINKGDVWTFDGETIQWLKDMEIDSILSATCMLINGIAPEDGDIIPRWATHDGAMLLTPPDGVIVTRAALGGGA
jgi:hypothetical protein